MQAGAVKADVRAVFEGLRPYVWCGLFAFLAARAALPMDICFMLPAVTALYDKGRGVPLFSGIAGRILAGGAGVPADIAAGIISFSIMAIMSKKAAKFTRFRILALEAGAAAAGLAGARFFFPDSGPEWMWLIKLGACWLMLPVFYGSLRSLSHDIGVIGDEGRICIALTAAVLTAGLDGIGVDGFRLRGVAAAAAVMFSGRYTGAAAGASVGALFGASTAIFGGGSILAIGHLAAGGLICGASRRLPKLFTPLGYILFNAVLTLYTTASAETVLPLGESAAAAVLLIAVPSGYAAKQAEKIRCLLHEPVLLPSAGDESIKRRLAAMSEAFECIGGSLSSCAAEESGGADRRMVMEGLRSGVCFGCPLRRACWDGENPKDSPVAAAFERAVSGRLAVLPAALARRCMRPAQMLDSLNRYAHTYRGSRLWANRFNEIRELVTDAFGDAGRLLASAAEEAEDADDELLRRFLEICRQDGIRPLSAGIKKASGRYSLRLRLPPCDAEEACGRLRGIAEEITGRDMNAAWHRTRGADRIVRIDEAGQFRPVTGYAMQAKTWDRPSGDAISYGMLDGGRFFAAVSDGMGSGEDAAKVSAEAVDMLAKLLAAGFSGSSAIENVNRFLLLRDDIEIYSTLDLFLLDVCSGNAEFYKIGSPPGIIRRGGTALWVSSESPPVGILGSVNIDCAASRLIEGDMIILMTDGISERFAPEGLRDGVEEILFRGISDPQVIADTIMDEASALPGESDDMTVIAVSIEGIEQK